MHDMEEYLKWKASATQFEHVLFHWWNAIDILPADDVHDPPTPHLKFFRANHINHRSTYEFKYSVAACYTEWLYQDMGRENMMRSARMNLVPPRLRADMFRGSENQTPFFQMFNCMVTKEGKIIQPGTHHELDEWGRPLQPYLPEFEDRYPHIKKRQTPFKGELRADWGLDDGRVLRQCALLGEKGQNCRTMNGLFDLKEEPEDEGPGPNDLFPPDVNNNNNIGEPWVPLNQTEEMPNGDMRYTWEGGSWDADMETDEEADRGIAFMYDPLYGAAGPFLTPLIHNEYFWTFPRSSHIFYGNKAGDDCETYHEHLDREVVKHGLFKSFTNGCRVSGCECPEYPNSQHVLPPYNGELQLDDALWRLENKARRFLPYSTRSICCGERYCDTAALTANELPSWLSPDPLEEIPLYNPFRRGSLFEPAPENLRRVYLDYPYVSQLFPVPFNDSVMVEVHCGRSLEDHDLAMHRLGIKQTKRQRMWEPAVTVPVKTQFEKEHKEVDLFYVEFEDLPNAKKARV